MKKQRRKIEVEGIEQVQRRRRRRKKESLRSEEIQSERFLNFKVSDLDCGKCVCYMMWCVGTRKRCFFLSFFLSIFVSMFCCFDLDVREWLLDGINKWREDLKQGLTYCSLFQKNNIVLKLFKLVRGWMDSELNYQIKKE